MLMVFVAASHAKSTRHQLLRRFLDLLEDEVASSKRQDPACLANCPAITLACEHRPGILPRPVPGQPPPTARPPPPRPNNYGGFKLAPIEDFDCAHGEFSVPGTSKDNGRDDCGDCSDEQGACFEECIEFQESNPDEIYWASCWDGCFVDED